MEFESTVFRKKVFNLTFTKHSKNPCFQPVKISKNILVEYDSFCSAGNKYFSKEFNSPCNKTHGKQ